MMVRDVVSKLRDDYLVVLLGQAVRLWIVGSSCNIYRTEKTADEAEIFTYNLRSIDCQYVWVYGK